MNYGVEGLVALLLMMWAQKLTQEMVQQHLATAAVQGCSWLREILR